jgi:5-(aminomethyl)-3-furanmethanol phosphate kinase
MNDPHGPVVVKLGGSFAFSRHLRDWIAALAICAGRVVIVPGGGPFADTVRSAQRRMGFGDRAAHEMAILAMEQFGRALASLDTRLSPADTVEAIRGDLDAGRVPVWMPARLALRADDIAPPSWELTSDSLAAWLAARIGARRLFLVKHVEPRLRAAPIDDLAAIGVVDAELPRRLQISRMEAFVFGPSDHGAAVAAVRGQGAVETVSARSQRA